MSDAIVLDELTCELKHEVAQCVPHANLDLCLTCGACTGGCPASRQYDMDPRRFLRMLLLGMDEEIVKKSPGCGSAPCADGVSRPVP